MLADSVQGVTDGLSGWGTLIPSVLQPISTSPAHDRNSVYSLKEPLIATKAVQLSSNQFSGNDLDFESEILQNRLDHIFRDLGRLVISPTFKGDKASQLSALMKAKTILTAPTALKFTESYFKLWHPNCAFLHKSTFDPCGVILPLLLSVLLMGAVYSPIPAHRKITQDIADIAEQYAFQQPELSEDFTFDYDQSTITSILHMQALQSAMFMLTLQNWQGTKSTKVRVRNAPMSKLIKVRLVDPVQQALLEDFTDDSN
jgi:Fungal specific transcription factor domain